MPQRNPRSHTLANLELTLEEVASSRLPPLELLDRAQELVAHGHPQSLQAIERVTREIEGGEGEFYGRMLKRSYDQIRRFYHFEAMPRDFLEELYKKEGSTYLSHKNSTRKMVVVFTTMFNNMFYANTIISSLFSMLECNILFLRDSSAVGYVNGSHPISPDFPGIGNYIATVAEQNGIQETYITGFSSSGFPALLTSLRIPCNGFLGFSHGTDTLNTAAEYDFLVKQMPPRWRLDLREVLPRADPDVPRAIYYGERNQRDGDQARHLDGLETIEVISLPKTGHNTVQALFLNDRLLEAFAVLVSGRRDWPQPSTMEAESD